MGKKIKGPEQSDEKESSDANNTVNEGWNTGRLRSRKSTQPDLQSKSTQPDLKSKSTQPDSRSKSIQPDLGSKSTQPDLTVKTPHCAAPQDIGGGPNTNEDKRKYLSVVFVIILLLVACSAVNFNQDKDFDVDLQFESLKASTPPQEKRTWEQIKFGMMQFQNQSDTRKKSRNPLVYLLMGDDQDALNRVATSFVDRISLKIDKEPVIVDCSIDCSSRDMFSLQEPFKESKIMFVKDAHLLPSRVAEGLHYVCDQENPTVPNSIVVLTMLDDGNKDNLEPKKRASKLISSVWSALPYKKLEPLISRLCGFVLEIKGSETVSYETT